jgi:hypothetical protein
MKRGTKICAYLGVPLYGFPDAPPDFLRQTKNPHPIWKGRRGAPWVSVSLKHVVINGGIEPKN